MKTSFSRQARAAAVGLATGPSTKHPATTRTRRFRLFVAERSGRWHRHSPDLHDLAAVSGLRLRVMDVNILAQVGFVVLVGLAAKNAILIVEFARQDEARGQSRFDAVVGAARTRLRPILMTSFAFVFGVLPLAVATGAGAEMRQSLGTAVVFGMLGVTAFGLMFTPVFYSVVRWLFAKRQEQSPGTEAQLSTRAAE